MSGEALKACKPLPSQAEILHFLQYDREDGDLFWLPRDDNLFTCRAKARSWNTRYAGQRAFTSQNGMGYRLGNFHNQLYFAHRIIWKLAYGADPMFIDHINGDTSDNRLGNMRDATKQQNSFNYSKPRGLSSFRGVTTAKDRNWSAQISLGGGKKLSLGSFVVEAEAAAAYDAAARHLHGEFATLNFPDVFFGTDILSPHARSALTPEPS